MLKLCVVFLVLSMMGCVLAGVTGVPGLAFSSVAMFVFFAGLAITIKVFRWLWHT